MLLLPSPRACRRCGRHRPGRTRYRKGRLLSVCRSCKDSIDSRRRHRNNQYRRYFTMIAGFCAVCRKPLICLSAQGRTWCSRVCRDFARRSADSYMTKLRRWRRAGRARRERIGTGPRFERVSVLNRDGWRCMICGRDTPRELLGSMDDRAPEVDHRIPLRAGGMHTWWNLQTVCRGCNNAKGARIVLCRRLPTEPVDAYAEHKRIVFQHWAKGASE